MKEKIIVKRDALVLYKGPILNIPIKEDCIIKKSIEVFGDEDPCIIHQSFVVKELVDELLDLLKKGNTSILNVKDYLEELSFINLKDLETVTIELMG